MASSIWVLDEVLARRPSIRINQWGYLPGAPVRATMVFEGAAPVSFSVVDSRGKVVAAGSSQPWMARPDPSSGAIVHVLDAGVELPIGRPLHFVSGDRRSHPFRIDPDLYAPLCGDSLRVLRLLRSGAPVTDDVLAGYARPAGHVDLAPHRGDRAVAAWSGPDAERIYPGWQCGGTFDVSGGWYDAGDYGKYVTSGSIACWQLLGTLDLLPRDPAGEALSARVRDEARWQLEWLLRMQVPPGSPLAGMAFHRVHGTEWSPVPGLPHEDPTRRVLHRPSTNATFHLAAVAAMAARHFAPVDPSFAGTLLAAARTAFDAGSANPALVAPDDGARFGGGPYGDPDPSDDHYWACAELWITTGEPSYLHALRRSPWHSADVFRTEGFDFDAVAAPAQLDLALHGSSLPDQERVLDRLVEASGRLLRLAERQPWGQPYAPASGWGWGSNGRLLNNLVVLAVAHRLTADERYFLAVAEGMDYLLGRNALGQSYITGYGTDATAHQRTRQFGHDLDPALPPPPPGAIAGGANSQPHPDFPYDDRLIGLPPQCCYLDEASSEVTNDICIRWNAPLTFVAAFLARAWPAADPQSVARSAPAKRRSGRR